MNKKIFVGVVLLLVGASAQADWESTVKIQVPKGDNESGEMSAFMRSKNEKMRIDMKTPVNMSSIIDAKAKKAFNLMHEQKMMMEADFSDVEKQAPVCNVKDIDSCFKKQGFKKAGSEKVNGHPCTVYESAKMKVWRPNDLKDVPTVRMVSTESGEKTQIDFMDIKVVKQADHYFAVPKDYQSMGAPKDLLKGLQGGIKGIKLPGMGD